MDTEFRKTFENANQNTMLTHRLCLILRLSLTQNSKKNPSDDLFHIHTI